MIICGCGTQMKVKKIGVAWASRFGEGEFYQLHMGDLLECPGCGTRVISATSVSCDAHYNASFQPLLQKYREAGTLYEEPHAV